MARRYWLFKTEPESFSIQDLAHARHRRTVWDGVRNYQARNFLRDDVRVGDGVLFYHSNANPAGVAGTARVVAAGHPDHTATDPGDPHFDPKSDPDEPRWFAVDIELDQVFPAIVPLATLRETPGLEGMELLRKGSRLSIQPVTTAAWKRILRLGGSVPS